MSPTILIVSGYRIYFFSREERRAHVHVHHAEGDAKFWLDRHLELAHNYGLSARRLAKALRLIKEHEDEIRKAWKSRHGG